MASTASSTTNTFSVPRRKKPSPHELVRRQQAQASSIPRQPVRQPVVPQSLPSIQRRKSVRLWETPASREDLARVDLDRNRLRGLTMPDSSVLAIYAPVGKARKRRSTGRITLGGLLGARRRGQRHYDQPADLPKVPTSSRTVTVPDGNRPLLDGESPLSPTGPASSADPVPPSQARSVTNKARRRRLTGTPSLWTAVLAKASVDVAARSAPGHAAAMTVGNWLLAGEARRFRRRCRIGWLGVCLFRHSSPDEASAFDAGFAECASRRAARSRLDLLLVALTFDR